MENGVSFYSLQNPEVFFLYLLSRTFCRGVKWEVTNSPRLYHETDLVVVSIIPLNLFYKSIDLRKIILLYNTAHHYLNKWRGYSSGWQAD